MYRRRHRHWVINYRTNTEDVESEDYETVFLFLTFKSSYQMVHEQNCLTETGRPIILNRLIHFDYLSIVKQMSVLDKLVVEVSNFSRTQLIYECTNTFN